MSTRTTLILLAVLVLVAAVVYFTQIRKPEGGAATPAAPESKSLLDVSMPAISGITIRDVLSGTQVSATRDVSGTWWLVEPPNQVADPAALNSMASRLSYIYVQRTLTPTVSLSEFGLSAPRYSVQVSTDSGVLAFTVGDSTPSGGAFYAQKPDDPHVYLVDSSLVGELQRFVTTPPVAAPPTPVPASLPMPAGP